MKIELTPEQIRSIYNLGKTTGFSDGIHYNIPAVTPSELDFIKYVVKEKNILTEQQFDEVFKDE